MNNSSPGGLRVPVFIGVLGCIGFFLLYNVSSPEGGLDLRYSRSEIMEKGAEYLRSLGYAPGSYQQDCWLEIDSKAESFLQAKFGLAQSNAMVKADSLPVYSWHMSWYDRKVSRSQALETFRLWMSPAGRVTGFDHFISDTARGTSLPEEEAREKAFTVLEHQGFINGQYVLKTSSQTRQQNRLDHQFVWARGDSSFEIQVSARVQGDEVGSYRVEFIPGSTFQKTYSEVSTTATFLVMGSFAVFFLLFFFIVILFLKKYHEGEVGTRTGIIILAALFILAVLAEVNQYPAMGQSLQMGDLNKFNTRIISFIINVFIFQVFLSVMVFAAWSVGESSSRTVWPEKMTSIDSVLFGSMMTVDVGRSLVCGYALGFGILGGFTLIVYALTSIFHTWVYPGSFSGIAEALVPSAQPLLVGITAAVFAEIVFRLFFVSYLREKLRNRVWGIIIAAAAWTVTAFVMWSFPLGRLPFVLTFSFLFLIGLVFIGLYLRYDVLTTITANTVILGFNAAIPILGATGPAFDGTRWVMLALFAIPLVVGIRGLMKGKRFEFTPETLPAHIRRISERERMAKELEIARRVQMSLLPKVNPLVPGYDIAGICLPAREVGGDYYDFVNLGGKKLGIAIGDVSGKGVPAAIYMTLTKGILQSHAEEHVSPKTVLSKVNGLMYRTIERNSFVSMFYAILDIEQRSIVFARAGQCPAIVATRPGTSGTFLTPKGMALGLENGTIFDSVLEERELTLSPGEVLLFYTDGFTEAMNAIGDEFGEDRLVASLGKHRSGTASGIIQNICLDVNKFIGDHPQHDDMTMVVLKVP